MNPLFQRAYGECCSPGLLSEAHERRNGPTVIQRQTVIEQNAYQQSLEEGLVPPELTTESVRYWSDFNRVYFHPKSIIQLNEYELGSSLMPFENWTAGEELFNSLDKEHDLLDRDLRPFAEEADQMQGIQLMSGIDDAWGGFAARYMDRIRDEYGKTTIWLWGLEDGVKTIPRVSRLPLNMTSASIDTLTGETVSQAIEHRPIRLGDCFPGIVVHSHDNAVNVTKLRHFGYPFSMARLRSSFNGIGNHDFTFPIEEWQGNLRSTRKRFER
jgi:hypothetical protein